MPIDTVRIRPITAMGDWLADQRAPDLRGLVEASKIDTLDAAMEQAGFGQVTIKHGSGNMVTHWAVETANLYVVAEGVQLIGEMKHTEDRYGIAFGWRTLEGGRQRSVLRFRGFLQELLNIGFYEPLLITAKSTLTGDLINALTRQYKVLDAVDTFHVQDKKPPMNPLSTHAASRSALGKKWRATVAGKRARSRRQSLISRPG